MRPDPEDPPEQPHVVLALELGGSTLQAIQEEVAKLNLHVMIYAISSVVPQTVPGDDSTTALLAAETTWGTRIITPMRSLEWISSEYKPSSRERPARRWLLLWQIQCKRPWAPLDQPAIMLSGQVQAQVGILIQEIDIESWRNTIARAKSKLVATPLASHIARTSSELTAFY